MQIQSEYHGYFLTECIKQHEYGTVYRGHAGEETGPEVLVKIFNTQLISLRERQRFLQEANVLTSLRHPALLPLLEVGLDKGNPYLIRGYAPEGSLITQLSQQEGLAFPLPMLMAILTRISAAVAYLHQEQISHGSIKPENILFDTHQQAVLADVHVASIFPEIPSTVYEPVLTERGLVLWEQPIIAPDDKQSRMQDDIYALSSMAYELLTGYQPFTSTSEQDVLPVPPSHWTPSLPKKVDQVFLQALSPHPEERFSSPTFFVEALRFALDTSTKITSSPLLEKQIEFQEPVDQLSLFQPPAEQRLLVPFQVPTEQKTMSSRLSTVHQQSSFGHDLLEGIAVLKSQLFIRSKRSGQGKTGANVARLLLIILAILLVLGSIFVPFLLFHPRSNPTNNTHKIQNQARSGRTASIATGQPGPTATHIHNQRPSPTASPRPTPDPTPVPVPVLVNAGFEAPALNGDYEYAPNNSGWLFSNGCGIGSNGSSLTQGTANAPWGAQVAFIQAYGTMSQNVSFAQGKYRISFLAAQRVSSSSTQSLWVLIDNTVVGSFTPGGGNYLYYTTLDFTVSPGIHTLQFRGLRGGAHNTVFIDSVTILHG